MDDENQKHTVFATFLGEIAIMIPIFVFTPGTICKIIRVPYHNQSAQKFFYLSHYHKLLAFFSPTRMFHSLYGLLCVVLFTIIIANAIT